ncbi:PRKCA, partial [Cordylochernes scorpioides]
MGRTFSRRNSHGIQESRPPKPPNALRKFLKKFKRNRKVGIMTERLPIPELPLQIEDITEEEEPCQRAVIKTLPYTLPTCTNNVLNIEDFERILTIGKGGFGRVFLARHKESEEHYALKAMKKRTDFKTEREVLQIAKGFPFLMGLVTSFETPEEDILVMDLVKGFNFLYYLNKWKKISEENARFYTAETALALHFLHSHNIIHRDVKLENILLNFDGHIKLVDYGLCKLNVRPGQKTSRCCGTLKYMAPEVVQNKPYDFSVDWWSLGATLYIMLVGHSAFEPTNEAENNKECIAEAIVNKPIDIPDGLSIPAVSVLRAFMTRDPESRLGSHPENGWGDIKRHIFYRPLDFNDVLSRNVPPPLPAPELPLQIEDVTEEEEPCQTAVLKTLPFTIPTCTNSVLKIEDFERILTIGKGGFGRVFLAQHKESEQYYALKAMKKRTDFKTEREVLQIAKGFPFLMGLVTSFETPEEDILVMDLVRGFNLLHYLNKWGTFSETQARFYTAETALALHCLHSHNIIHRDVKLQNILINIDGHIKLIDYGLCKLNIKPGQKTSRCCGTLAYMAPEIVSNKPYDFSVDWWALGATIYEMLVGRSAFKPSNAERDNQEYIVEAIKNKPIDIPNDLSIPAVSVLRGFLTKDPESRLGSHPENGWGDIKIHPFYRPLDFNEVLSRNVPPPFIPK